MLLTLTLALALVVSAPPPDFHGDPLPPGASMRLGTTRLRLASFYPGGVAASRDGKRVVGIGHDRARVFRADDGKILHDIPLDGSPTHTTAVSPDARFAAFHGTSNGGRNEARIAYVHLFDLTTGKPVRVVGRAEPAAACRRYGDSYALAFSHDGKYLASMSGDDILRVEDVASGGLVAKEPLKRERPRIAFSPDGKTIAVGGDGGEIRVWAWRSGKPSRGVDVGVERVTRLAFAPDGRRLAIASEGGEPVRVWDVVAGKIVGEPKVGAGRRRPDTNVTALAWSPDGGCIACVLHDGATVALWDGRTYLAAGFLNFADTIEQVAFSPDGSRLLTQGRAGLRVWDNARKKESVAAGTQRHSILHLALARDGTAVTMGGPGSEVQAGSTANLYDAKTGRPRHALGKENAYTRALALAADGATVAVWMFAGHSVIWIYDARTGAHLSTLRVPPDLDYAANQALAFSADGRHLHGWDSSLRLCTWDVVTGRLVSMTDALTDGKRPDAASRILSPTPEEQFSPGARFVSASLKDKGVYVFDTATGGQVGKVLLPTRFGRHAAVSPDGKHLLTTRPEVIGRERGVAAEVYDVASGTKVRSATLTLGDEGPVCFAPGGDWYAACSVSRGTAKSRVAVRDSRTDAFVADFDVPGRTTSVVASADGGSVVVGLEDATALVYPLPEKKGRR